MSTTPTQGAAASSSQGIRGSQQGQEWSQRGGNQLQWIFFMCCGAGAITETLAGEIHDIIPWEVSPCVFHLI